MTDMAADKPQYRDLNTQERLAALQSATIFLVLQAEDPESAGSNDAGALLATVTVILCLAGMFFAMKDVADSSY